METEDGRRTMARRSPPTKLNIGDIAAGPPSASLAHQTQGIAALFAITFDLRAGYTITWQRPEDMNISGVEFKSMPSGLHNVTEDLVYFVMPPYAGLSAYYRNEAVEEERNARMVAIGVLVPSTGRYGRLGRAWDHATQLKSLAQMYADNPNNTAQLQLYFDAHYDPTMPRSAYPTSPLSPPATMPLYVPKHLHSGVWKGQTLNRKRSISDTAVPFRGIKLSTFHPAMSFPDLISTFGPLIFVLYRAALCRKRILFLAPVPVEQTCHFVYNTSVLATIPPSVSDLIINEPNRLRTLFCIGVNDIPILERLAQPDDITFFESSDAPNECGWVACTTDVVLASKPHLYDLLIILPSCTTTIPGSKIPSAQHHPIITCSRTNSPVLPTLRDLRRWKRLLLEMPLPRPPGPDPEFDELVYQRTWTEFICSGLCWWATAGEAQYGTATEEFDADDDDDYFLREPPARRGTLGEGVPLLQRSDTIDSLTTPVYERPGRGARIRSDTVFTLSRSGAGSREADVGVMVYFHRMTARMLSSLAGIIDANELVEPTGEEVATTTVGVEDLMRMGIDWGEREFVREMCLNWFGRDVGFESRHRSECCY